MSKTQTVQYMPDVMPGGDLAIPPPSDDSIEWRVRVISRSGAVTNELTWVVNEWLESGSMAYTGDEPVIVPEPEEAPAIQQTRVELERLEARSIGYACTQCGRDFVPGTECLCTGEKILDTRMGGGELLYNMEPTPEKIKTFVETSGIRACDTCGQLTLLGSECFHTPVAVEAFNTGMSVEPASARILPIDKMTQVDAMDMLVMLLGGPDEVGRLIGQPESYVRSWSNGAQPENAVVQTLIDTVASRFRAVARRRNV